METGAAKLLGCKHSGNAVKCLVTCK